MRKNRNTKIYGKSVVLVPYKKHHVPRYHDWMQSSELQELTASEPLSLEQEYEMQQSWLVDDDKCTFIILSTDLFTGTEETDEKEIGAMIGDVNLFFNDQDDRTSAEVEIMIAVALQAGETLFTYNGTCDERQLLMSPKLGLSMKRGGYSSVVYLTTEKSSRGKGRGKEALLSMFQYGRDALGVKTFTAKIGLLNEVSQKMFQRLGFQEVSRSEVFQEVTLSLPLTPEFSNMLDQQTKHLKIVDSS